MTRTPKRTLVASVAFGSLALAACGGGGPGGGDPSLGMAPPAPTAFDDVQVRVFDAHCNSGDCHGGRDAPFGLELTSGNAFDNLVGVPSAEVPAFLRVAPRNAAESYLYLKLVDDPRILGDPMPAFRDPLDPDLIALVVDWIEGGAAR